MAKKTARAMPEGMTCNSAYTGASSDQPKVCFKCYSEDLSLRQEASRAPRTRSAAAGTLASASIRSYHKREAPGGYEASLLNGLAYNDDDDDDADEDAGGGAEEFRRTRPRTCTQSPSLEPDSSSTRQTLGLDTREVRHAVRSEEAEGDTGDDEEIIDLVPVRPTIQQVPRQPLARPGVFSQEEFNERRNLFDWMATHQRFQKKNGLDPDLTPTAVAFHDEHGCDEAAQQMLDGLPYLQRHKRGGVLDQE